MLMWFDYFLTLDDEVSPDSLSSFSPSRYIYKPIGSTGETLLGTTFNPALILAIVDTRTHSGQGPIMDDNPILSRESSSVSSLLHLI